MSSWKSSGRECLRYTKLIIIIVVPLLLIPLPVYVPNELGYTAYTALLMAVFWVTQVLPLAITALIPIILFPLLGVASTTNTISAYISNVVVLLFGGLVLAAALEHHNLHKRIALKIVLLIGSQPSRLLFGFMVTTAFLSMWMSNTAATALMLPIARAVLEELNPEDERDKIISQERAEQGEADVVHLRKHGTDDEDLGNNQAETEFSLDAAQTQHGDTRNVTMAMLPRHSSKQHLNRYNRFSKGVVMSIPFAANIGGVACLTGTPTNIIFVAQAESLFGPEIGINYSNWMLYAIPGTFVTLVLSWMWLQWFHCSNRCSREGGNDQLFEAEAIQKTSSVVQREYDQLGPIKFAEWIVLFHFIALVMLWFFRAPGFMPGWSSLVKTGYVTDACSAIIVAVSLFIFPSEAPRHFRQNSESDDVGYHDQSIRKSRFVPTIVNWEIVNSKMPWEVFLLIGGGFALANASKTSGLSDWLAANLSVLNSVHPVLLVFLVSFGMSLVTEIITNTATATLFLPIVAEIAVGVRVNPLYLMFPATFAASFSFMLPTSTAPNAIAFTTSRLTVLDMVKSGFVLNMIGVGVSMVAIHTLGRWIYHVNEYPVWAERTGVSVPMTTTYAMDTLIYNTTVFCD